MGTYILDSRSKYEVADRKLDDAVRWLEENRCGTGHATASYRTDTSIITASEEMFGGDVSYSWHEDVADFLELFCLPGSYATFRDDDEFFWYMAELGADGKVEWHEEQMENPFEKRCDELEGGKRFDACPKCGEEREIEYGNVHAEGGAAWHGVTCLKCGFKYTLEYGFETVDWEEA